MKAAHRWSLLGLAALLTAAAMAWVDRPADELVPQVSARAAPPAVVRKTRLSGPHWALPQRAFAMSTSDPFLDASEAEPATPATLREPMAAAGSSAAVPGAPPLPFSYMGQWVENGVVVAFLTTPQGLNLAARAGATLEGSYRVEAIDGLGIDFKYLPLNTRQRLSFADVPAPAAESPAATVAPIAAPETEESN